VPARSDRSLSVSLLSKRFAGHPAVERVTFAAERASALALLGPSGCGKTTILRCIAGLETPDEGRIEVDGKVVFDASLNINVMPEHRGLGVVFQSYAVWPHMTVGENVGFPLRVRKVDRGEAAAAVRRVLDAVNLSAYADRPATELSGGQQQRVALARALVHEPAVVLFDEALSNLDKLLREQMRLELKALQERLGFTALYVTHDQDEALGLADALVLLNAGRVQAAGPAKDVFRCAESAFSARFFGWNVIPAVVIANDGAGAAVRAGDAVLHLARAAGSVGERIEIGFRREHVFAHPIGMTAGKRANALPARVQAASFQGLQNEYLLDIGGGLSIRSVQPAIDVAQDDPVEAVVAPEHILAWTTEDVQSEGEYR
jgi:iron(III) transport system ATP-binding protein